MSAFKDWLNGLTSKTTPADADVVHLRDSEDAGASKKLTWANLKATLKTYFDTVYSTFDGAYSSLSGKPTLGTAASKDTGTSAGNVVVLDGTGKLPAVDGSQLTGIAAGGSPGGSAGQMQYGDGSALQGAPLWREDANTVAQRNGTTAQAFRVFNTYTDGSNYERGFIKWDANVMKIGMEAAGTGSLRELAFYGSWNTMAKFYSGTSVCAQIGESVSILCKALGIGYWNASAWTVGFRTPTDHPIAQISANANSAVGAALEFVEMSSAPSAPSANNVRIYAEDNGSGKTRLMALFSSGSAVQLAIEP